MLKINEELRDLISPLSFEEKDQLTKNILEYGIREPIITWQGYIIDGHNRYDIAQNYELEYKTMEISRNTIDDVKIWMIDNQLGRRNLNSYDRTRLALLKESIFANQAKNRQKGGQGGVNLLVANLPQAKGKTREKVADIAEVSPRTVQNVKKIEAKASEEDKKALSAGEKSINEVVKDIVKKENQEKLVQKKIDWEERVSDAPKTNKAVDIHNTDQSFRIVYADPAWSYNDKQNTPKLGGAAKHYGTMSTTDICALPVNEITEKNAVLFLWVTSPLLEDGLKVIKEWGFKYKTSFIWDKIKHNMGHYNSVRHEFLLVATKGSCTPDVKKLFDSVQSIERNDNHSEKPIDFIDIIDTIYTHGDRLEMFCRKIKKENTWYGWGNEL